MSRLRWTPLAGPRGQGVPGHAAGDGRLLDWLGGFGTVCLVGIEGTGSYGAGGPPRHHGRRRGRGGGPLGPAGPPPPGQVRLTRRRQRCPCCPVRPGRGASRGRDGAVEAIRALMVAKRSAAGERTQTNGQARALVLTGPDVCGPAPPGTPRLPWSPSWPRYAPARQHRRLRHPHRAARAGTPCGVPRRPARAPRRAHRPPRRRPRPRAPRPLRDRHLHRGAAAHRRRGPPERLRSEAAWAHLCGAAPIPASSGKTVRRRLNPGGDRQANHALWRIVFTRLGSDPATRAYAERRTAEGKSRKEIIRCLKRYVAREGSLIPPPRHRHLTCTPRGGLAR